MREEYQRDRTSALTWLVSAMIAGVVLQLAMSAPFFRGENRFDDFFGLSVAALQHGWIWTLFTHAFLHSTTFILHPLFNVLALYFLGRELLPMLGPKRFVGLFAAATIAGGLTW